MANDQLDRLRRIFLCHVAPPEDFEDLPESYLRAICRNLQLDEIFLEALNGCLTPFATFEKSSGSDLTDELCLWLIDLPYDNDFGKEVSSYIWWSHSDFLMPTGLNNFLDKKQMTLRVLWLEEFFANFLNNPIIKDEICGTDFGIKVNSGYPRIFDALTRVFESQPN